MKITSIIALVLLLPLGLFAEDKPVDLRLVMAKMFPGENVSPTFTSYNAMVVKWRGSRPAPTLDEIKAQAAIIEEERIKERREAKARAEGVTDKAKLEALWAKLMENKPDEAATLQTKLDAIKAEIPDKK